MKKSYKPNLTKKQNYLLKKITNLAMKEEERTKMRNKHLKKTKNLHTTHSILKK